MNRHGLRILSTIVTIYMLLALIWWSVLLFKSNQEILDLKEVILQNEMNQVYKTKDFDISKDSAYKSIQEERRRKAIMVLGEGFVFGVSLLLGIFFIQRSHYREIKASDQQNNFLLAITHELKSPLTAIKMGLQTLGKHNLQKDLHDEIVNDSEGEVNRLEDLINNLLLTSRIHGGYQFDFAQHNIVNHLQNFINKRMDQNMAINLIYEKEIELFYDYNTFDIVFSNLIENAEKHGGQNLKISTISEGKQVKICFIDDGPGMLESEKSSVFNKFYRIGSEETRKTKGTGLGLYIVKEIISGHNGNIQIITNKTKGCNFQITIPKIT